MLVLVHVPMLMCVLVLVLVIVQVTVSVLVLVKLPLLSQATPFATATPATTTDINSHSFFQTGEYRNQVFVNSGGASVFVEMEIMCFSRLILSISSSNSMALHWV